MSRTYTGPPNDVLALAQALVRRRSCVPAAELLRAHADAGGTLEDGAVEAALRAEGWRHEQYAWFPPEWAQDQRRSA